MRSIEEIMAGYVNEEVVREEMENGLVVLMKEDNGAEVVSVQVWVKTGSIHEGPYMGSGISHYVEHMLFKGTQKRSYSQISEEIQRVGGNVNAYTTFDRTVYYVDGPVEGFGVYLDVLADIAMNSVMDDEEAKKEKEVILREISMGKDDPERELSEMMFKTAYKKHGYRYPVIGEREIFEQLVTEDLKNYYKKRYVPNNMVVVVVGAMKVDEMRAAIKEKLGGYKARGLEGVYMEEEREQLVGREMRKVGDYEIVRGGMVYKIPGLEHGDTAGISILANMLGQGESSYLWQKLREEAGIVHQISASAWNPGAEGLFWIGYTCDNGKRKEVEKAIEEALKAFRGITIEKAKLEKAIRQAMVSEVNSRKTMSGQAGKLGLSEVVAGDIFYSRMFIERLKKVTIEEVRAVQDKYLVNEKRSLVTLEREGENEVGGKRVREKEALKDFEVTVFENGARILVQENRGLPKVYFKVLFRGGPYYEKKGVRGVTGVMGTLLTKDTKKRSAYEVAEAIESVGGSLSEFIGNNSFGLGIEVLSSDVELAVDLLKGAITEIDFQEEEFLTEKQAQIAAIKEEMDDISSYGMRLLREKFFGDFPYAYDSLGKLEELEGLSLGDVAECFREFVRADNMVIAVSGDIEKGEVLKAFEWVKGMEKREKGSRELRKFEGVKAGYYKEAMDREQAVVFEGYEGVGVWDKEDFEVAEVIDEMLSGMTSRLFLKVREEQSMAYFVGSSQVVGMDTGMFYLYAGTNQESYEKVFEEFSKELERIKRGEIGEEELERCKTRLIAGQRMSLQTPGSRATQSGLDGLYGLGINRFRDYEKRVRAVDVNRVMNFAKRKFNPEKRLRLVVGKI